MAALRASPEFDGDTLALAAALIDEMQLGRRATPDVLSISLSATDYVGHTYGTEGEEMCLQLTELDREIGDFLSVLDSRGIDYAVALTADHGGKDIPERERLAGVADAARVDAALNSRVMGTKLIGPARNSGPGPARRQQFGDIYIDRRLSPPTVSGCSTPPLPPIAPSPRWRQCSPRPKSQRRRNRPARRPSGA